MSFTLTPFAIESWNFPAVPFLILFVVGYWRVGFTTLYQEYYGKLRWQRGRAPAREKKPLRCRTSIASGSPWFHYKE